MRRGLQRFTNETKLQRNETKLQRNETKLQRVATSCVATKRQRVATSTTPTQVRHKSFLSRRRAALVATICSLLRDKTEKQTHDVSVGLLTQYVSLLREVCFCVSPRCAIYRLTSTRVAVPTDRFADGVPGARGCLIRPKNRFTTVYYGFITGRLRLTRHE
jgi:hypothetical protein